MREWWSAQVDYLAFAAGLALCVAALGAWRVAAGRPQARAELRRLAWFALASGAGEWLTQQSRLVAADASLLIAAVLLADLATRLDRTAGKPRRWARWPLAAAALALGAALLATGRSDGLLVYALNLPVSLWAAAALWRRPPVGPPTAARLAAAALVLRALGLVAALPAAAWRPVAALHRERFEVACGMPPETVSLLAAAMLLLAAWLWLTDRAGGRSASRRRADWGVLAALLTFVGAGWFATNYAGEQLAADLRDDGLRQASYLARTVSPESARRLAFSAADHASPAYRELREQMRQYNGAFHLWNTYSFARRGSQILFGPESLDEDDPMASPPGTVYEQPSAPFWRVLEGGSAVATGVYTDEYGTFHSALAPVYDPRTGEVIMAVGLDVQATDWRARVARERGLGIAATAALVAALLAIWLVGDWLHRRDAARHRRGLPPDLITAALTGLALTALAQWVVRGSEQRRFATEFRHLAEAQAQIISQALRDADEELVGVARQAQLDRVIDSQWLAQHAGAMNAKVGLRELWWAAAEEDDWRLITAGERVDVARVAGLRLVRDGQLNAAARLAQSRGVAVVAAEQAGRLGEDRRGDLLVLHASAAPDGGPSGLVVGVIDPQQILAFALNSSSYDPALLRVGLARLGGGQAHMAAWLPRSSPAARDLLTHLLNGPAGLRQVVFPVFLFGQAWALGIDASPGFAPASEAHAAGWTLAAGLTMTVFLCLLVAGYSTRRDDLEALVTARTASLRESEERLARIVATLPDAIFVADRGGRLVMANEAAGQQLGYTVEELLTRSLADIVAPEYRDRAAAQLRSLLAGQPVIPAGRLVESTHVRRDGQLVPIELATLPIVYDGQPCLLGIARDISERRVAEEALRASERRLRLLFESAGDAIFIMRGESFIDCNERTLSMFGCTKEDILGQPPYAVSPEHQPDGRRSAVAARSYIEAALAGQPQRFYWLHRRLDGTPFDAEVSLVTVDLGHEVLIQAIVRDITEQRRARQALEAETTRRRLLFEQSPDGIVIIDPLTTGFIEFNTAAHQQLGYTREEFTALTIHDVEAQESYEETRAHVAEVLRVGQADFETVQRTRTGELRNTHVTAQYLDIQGQPIYHCIWRDITEAKRAETATRRSESFRKRVFDGSVVPIVVMDAETHAFVDCNPAAVAIYRLASREDTLGLTPLDVSAPTQYDGTPSAALAEQYIQRALTDGSVQFDWRHQRPDGEVWDAEVDLMRFEDEGRPTLQFMLQDITERRRAQAEREALIAKLEQSNTELERFTYTVSHDLKSPLITIKGFLGWLRNDHASGRTDRVETSLDRINRAAEHMSRLLDELLELSRIGRLRNAAEPVALGALVQEAAELVSARLDQAQATLHIADDLPTVHGDRARLLEVFQNLLDNAAKFVGQAPLLIEVGCAGTDRDSGWPVIYVRDNGVGFEPTYAERIFGLFDQLDPKREGTGIGLAMVRRIVETHGGRVWAESDGPGQGACFSIVLPPAQTETP